MEVRDDGDAAPNQAAGEATVRRKKFWRVAVVVALVFFLAAGMISAVVRPTDREAKHIVAVGPTAIARVVAIQRGGDGDISRLELRYETANGHSEDVKVPVDHVEPLLIGDSVPVKYDPASPSRAIVVGNTTHVSFLTDLPILIISVGIFLALLLSIARQIGKMVANRWRRKVARAR